MKYQFTIHADALPKMLSVYKKTGGNLEIQPMENANIKVISDNEKFLFHDDLREIKLRTSISPIQDQSEIILKEVLSILQELSEPSTEVKTGCGPVAISGIDVSKIKLQRSKITEKKAFDFKLERPRSKWELIKILQEEFDKFPDDTEFTSFSVLGIGVGKTHYY